MKTLRDTNNHSCTMPMSQSTASSFIRHGLGGTNGGYYVNSNNETTGHSMHLQRHSRSYGDNQGIPSILNPNIRVFPHQNLPTHVTMPPVVTHPYGSMASGETNQFNNIFQAYLNNVQKFNNALVPGSEWIHPLFYLQCLNTNAMLMQQFTNIQNNLFSMSSEDNRSYSAAVSVTSNLPIILGTDSFGINSSSQTIAPTKINHVLQADSQVFVPQRRSIITQDELTEHAQSVYSRNLQRNPMQYQNDLIKHFNETTISPLPSNQSSATVPTVPNVNKIASSENIEMVVSVIDSRVSPSSCRSIQDQLLDAVESSASLVSVDDGKIMTKANSILDPGAPIFIPRRSQSQIDEDHETSSSSSDSDFNDFHYLDQFLDDFYPTEVRSDNHLVLRKKSEEPTAEELKENREIDEKYLFIADALGQGDARNKNQISASSSPIVDDTEYLQTRSFNKQQPSYSIYQLLNRFRNPRCHLVLPEWSRLTVLLPTVCSMRAHNYKIKRYFAYRRRLSEARNHHNSIVSAELEEIR